ncbi:hypothetical protein D1J51_00005 [Leucobacter sp. wl10]|nr:hypothetical protein D1J51_00005 [Leucobacter sp. wl10]
MPILYLVVGAVGALIGLILRRFIGLRWWIAPLAFIGAAWAFFFSSIWWKRRLHTGKLSTELLCAIDPRRGRARRRQEHIDRLMSSGIPMLGFDGIEDDPMIGGMSWSSDGVQRVTVRYSEERQTRVTDAFQAWDDAGQTNARALLENHRMSRLLTEVQSLQERTALLERARIGNDEPEWVATTLTIDGEELPASQISSDGVTAAYVRSGRYWISVLAPADAPLPALHALDGAERRRLAEESPTF